MKIKFLSYLTGFFLLAAGLTAIAAENKPEPLTDEEYQALIADFDKGRDCIYSRTINNWQILDKERLILHAPTKNRPYFVKLTMRSLELKFVTAIGVYSKFDNRFCPYGGNALFIDGNRYTIKAIKKIDKDTAKRLVAYNKTRKNTKD